VRVEVSLGNPRGVCEVEAVVRAWRRVLPRRGALKVGRGGGPISLGLRVAGVGVVGGSLRWLCPSNNGMHPTANSAALIARLIRLTVGCAAGDAGR
jgi:hypothetical protein